MREQDLRKLLREAPLPDTEAERRAWRVARLAFVDHVASTGGRRLRRPRRLAVAGLAAAVAAIVVAAATPPGSAVLESLRRAIAVGSVGDRNALPALPRLPSGGRLLVQSRTGPWVVNADGSRRLLGRYESATWSPHGLFLAATSAHELVAVEPGGKAHWSLSRPPRIHAPAWSPDGYRIAYLAGRSLRVVAGDGTGDRRLARAVRPLVPAWQPNADHVLAYVDGRGRVVARQTDSKNILWRTGRVADVSRLLWSPDGRHLLVLGATSAKLVQRGTAGAFIPAQAGTAVNAAAWAPDGDRLAYSTYQQASHQGSVFLTWRDRRGPHRARRILFSGIGRFPALAWSPSGRWLLLAWEDADQWLFLPLRGKGRPIAVARISRQFAPGSSHPSFPRLESWCCPP